MRDMLLPPLPHVADDFAANFVAASILPGHDTLRCRKYGHAKATVDARNLSPLDVDTQPWLAHALQPVQHGLAAAAIAQVDLQVRLRLALFHRNREVFNEAFLFEDGCDGDFYLRGRHEHRIVARRRGVPDPGQHIGDRITETHFSSPLAVCLRALTSWIW